MAEGEVKRQRTQDEIDVVWRWNLERWREEAELMKRLCHRGPDDPDWGLDEK